MTTAALAGACATAASNSAPTTRRATKPAKTAAKTTVGPTATPKATVVTAPPTTAAPTTTTPPAPPTTRPIIATVPYAAGGQTMCQSVVHIGDSTSVGLISSSYLSNPGDRIDAQYRRVGVVDVRLEISGARSIVETLANQVNAYDTAKAIHDAGYHGCWVFALGVTDTANVAVGSNTSRDERIRRMMSTVGGDPVMWLTARTLVTSGAWSEAKMQLWNDALHAALARSPNLKLLDWASVAQADWFAKDHIHYTSNGYAHRARIIADGLASTYPA
jgi:hypothetical protein